MWPFLNVRLNVMKSTCVRHIQHGALTWKMAPLKSYDNLWREWFWTFMRTLTNMHTLHIYRDNDTTIGLSVDLLLRLLWFMDTHAHTHSRHTWQPLTFLRRHEYEPFPSLSAYYYPHPISCRPHCLFRSRGDSGNTHTHTYVWLNPCTHIHVHEWWNIICAHRHSPLLPGEWLTLAAKSPRGFLTFIGCQSQRTRL